MTHLRTTYFEIVLREKNRISIIFTCHELKLVEDESLCVEMIVLYQFRVYYLGWVEGRQNFTINVESMNSCIVVMSFPLKFA